MCARHNICGNQIGEAVEINAVEPPPFDPETLTRGMEELIASAATGDLIFQSTGDPPPTSALADAVVLYPATREGVCHVSRFIEEYGRVHDFLVKVLDDNGIPRDQHSETINLLSQRDHNLLRLLTASSVNVSRTILTEDPELAHILNGR